MDEFDFLKNPIDDSLLSTNGAHLILPQLLSLRATIVPLLICVPFTVNNDVCIGI